MNEEQELRARLEAVDVPPSRIEMDVLVRDGRRQAFRRRVAQTAGGMGLAAAMLLAVPPILASAGAQPTAQVGAGRASASVAATASAGPCRMAELPVPSGMRDARPFAVDPTGKYVVGNSVIGQDFRPILWTDGQPQALPVPGKSVQLTDVNASGVAVGLVENATKGTEYVFRYENGAYTRLRTPPGNWQAYPAPAINAAGDVIINVQPRGNWGGKDSIVLLWKAGSTTSVKLPLPDGANVYDITDDGTIAGAMYEDGSAVAAYAWDQQGNGRKLELPAGEAAAAYAAQGNWATGGLWPSMSTALWNLQTGEVTKLGTQGPGEAVNAYGWVVVDGSVLRDGAVVELAAPTGQTSRAWAVSDTGLVVGEALTNGQNLGPRVWRC